MIFRLALVLGVIAVTVYALVDCLQLPEEQLPLFPRLGWVLVIGLLPGVGAVAYLLAVWWKNQAGRPAAPTDPWTAAPRGYVAPDDNPAFLRDLDRPQDPRDGREGESGGGR